MLSLLGRFLSKSKWNLLIYLLVRNCLNCSMLLFVGSSLSVWIALTTLANIFSKVKWENCHFNQHRSLIQIIFTAGFDLLFMLLEVTVFAGRLKLINRIRLMRVCNPTVDSWNTERWKLSSFEVSTLYVAVPPLWWIAWQYQQVCLFQ